MCTCSSCGRGSFASGMSSSNHNDIIECGELHFRMLLKFMESYQFGDHAINILIMKVNIFYTFLKHYCTVYQNTLKTMIQAEFENIPKLTEQICNQSFEFFVHHAPLHNANFPLMQITYTLWRKQAYSRLTTCHKSRQAKQMSICKFFQLSQRKYLPIFVHRIESEMNVYCRGVQIITEDNKKNEQVKKDDQLNQILIELGKSVWHQQLYIELLEDLLQLPYFEIFPENKKLFPRAEYATNNLFTRSTEPKLQKIANDAGKKMFKKMMTGATNAAFSRSMVMRINTLLGTFNPLCMAATFGIGKYMEYLDENQKKQKTELQLKQALEFSQSKTENMKTIYSQILERLQLMLNYPETNTKEEKEKIQKLFLKILQEEWLKIEEKVEEDGWVSVNLEEVEDFQMLNWT